jgi:hypothetical protein
MAVRYAADGRDHTRALGLGSTSQFSLSFWGKISSNRIDFTTFVTLDGGSASDCFMVQTLDDGTSVYLYTESTSASTLQSLIVGTWYYFGISVNGTAATAVIRGATTSTFNTYTRTLGSGTTNLANLRIGESAFTAEWLNGCVAAFRLWHGVTLTAEQLQAESYTYKPRRLANLVAWHPFLRTETTDFSGNGNTLSGGTNTTTEDGPPISWGSPNSYTYSSTPNTGQIQELGLATETNSVHGVGSQKVRTLGLAGDAASAQVLGKSKTQGVGLAATLESAHSLTRAKSVVLGVGGSTDSVSRLGRVKSLGLAGDVGSAQTLGRGKRLGIGQATGSETASPLGSSRNRVLGTVAESSTSLSLGMRKTKTLGTSESVDTALSVLRGKRLGIGLASSTETALLIAGSKTRLLGIVLESSSTQVVSKSKTRLLGIVESLDRALSLGGELGLANDTTNVLSLTAGKSKTLGTAQELVSSLSIGRSKTLSIAVVGSSDVVLAVRRIRLRGISVVSDTASALATSARKTVLIGTAVETNTAYPLEGESAPYVDTSHLTDNVAWMVGRGNSYRR